MCSSDLAENDNVWTTITTDPYTFGSEVVAANHNANLVPLPDETIIKKNITDPSWNLVPDSPYSILETSIFETKWDYVIVSNKNFILLVEAGFLGFMIFYVPYRIGERKKKMLAKNKKEENN